MTTACCRFCGEALTETVTDLGMSPPSNSFVSPQSRAGEMTFPLHALVCTNCWLVQLEAFEAPESIFSEYLYFSSFSDHWLAHCRDYVGQAVQRFGLGATSQVVEIASNDGYLLQYFRERGIPNLGIEPAANVAAAAIRKGIDTEVAFFGKQTAHDLAARHFSADLIVANNVLAHVPDINDFVAGLQILLKPGGAITIEFPALDQLISQRQFDTIYHEHFSYLSLAFVERLLQRHGLRVFDIEALDTHGGSLRVFACHLDAPFQPAASLVLQRQREAAGELEHLTTYRRFASEVAELKLDILRFFIRAHEHKRVVAGYGAPAKGNTLLNYCGIGPDLLPFTVDRSPHKQGKLLPGTRIPILHPDAIAQARPDYVLILPWNLRDEIMDKLEFIRAWGGRFVTFVPSVKII